MKKVVAAIAIYIEIFTVFNFTSLAGVPLNNLEGVGGCAFNPFAYTAGNPFAETKDVNNKEFSLSDVFNKPQIGSWYVHLGDTKIDWGTIGIAQTFFNRLEVSYGHEIIAISGSDTIYKDNLGLKFLLVKETDVIPAISFGAVFKRTSFDTSGNTTDSGTDLYFVATKWIKPVMLSGGILSTKGRTLGILGFDDDRDEVFFGNIDIMPFENIAVGFEYRQGVKYDTWKDADYWNTHLAWFVNKNLTLIAAYVNTGDHKSSSKVGLGDGVVVSVQYAF